MLTPEERQEIEAEFPRYPHKQAVCLDAMKIIQRHRGWVSDESLRDLGEVLNMTPEELDGVATFYNLVFRRPVGRHVVLICDSVTKDYVSVLPRSWESISGGLPRINASRSCPLSASERAITRPR